VTGVGHRLALEAAALVASLRSDSFYKHPGVAETIDWAAALVALGKATLDEGAVSETIGCLLKYQEDVVKARETALAARVERAHKVASQA